MTRLNQIVAIEKGVKQDRDAIWTKAYQTFEQDPRFQGLIRTYEPLNEGDQALPEERQQVQANMRDIVLDVTEALTRMFDVVTTKDNGNTEARANIAVDGQVIAGNVPVTTLLWLEKQLTDLHTFVRKMPILDASKIWTWDPQLGRYRSEETQTMRTTKKLQNHVLAAATEHHPAQVQTFNIDEPTGMWTVRHFSGAIPQAVREATLVRVGQIQEAVKFAREEANSIEIRDQHIGEDILAFIFEPVLEATAVA